MMLPICSMTYASISKEKLFDEFNGYDEKCKFFTRSKDAMKFISEVYNDTPII